MNCLLAAATVKEITPFLNYYRNGNTKPDIDILITGIGLTASTYALIKQIDIKKPGLVIQAGIAGCFDKNIALGSVVVIKQDTIADQTVIENKQLTTMFGLGLIKLNQAPYSKGWLINPHQELIKKTKLKTLKGVSVNHITTGKQMIRLYQKKFNASVESMEGSALHYTCLMERIPFLQIRGISNYVGERNKNKWKMKDAINNLNAVLVRMIDPGASM
ncbi:MAG: futalosine hydrolase [Chitinophagales bacterium]